MYHKRVPFGIVVLICFIVVSACSGASKSGGDTIAAGNNAGSVKMTIASSTWIGFSPLAIGIEKGFFTKRGLELSHIVMENVSDRRAAMAGNRIQGFATTAETHVITAASGLDVSLVLALDASNGGDGVVAKNSIQSLKDLKGKTVALHTGGGPPYFFLAYLLKQQGVSMKELTVQDMTSGDAGAAFVAGKVDAAVTWEPWLSKAKDTPFGTVLVTSKEYPDLLVDIVGLRPDFVKQNPAAVKALADGWFEALQFYKDQPTEALAIMAKFSGMTPKELEAQLPSVRFYGSAENEKYFDGPAQEILATAADFWLEEKIITKKPDLKALVAPATGK